MEDVLKALTAWILELVILTPIFGSLIIAVIAKRIGKD